MAIKFQYNKTSLQSLNKDLKMREKALPTIKSKEQALRLEAKRAKADYKRLEEELAQELKAYDTFLALWSEFDTSLVTVKDVHVTSKKIAGVNIPELDKIDFELKKFSLFSNPQWFMDGVSLMKQLATTGITIELFRAKSSLLEYARKKTTQKVNLFEKVQIPGYEEAIRKIKRFMEDEENLSKSAQKIVKARQEKQKQVEA